MNSVYWHFRLAEALSRWLPAAAAIALAERLAETRYAQAAGHRATVQANLRLAGLQPAAAREVFRNFGRYLVELFRIRTLAREAFTVEGAEHLAEAHSRGRGVIALTAHVGHWELGAAAIRALGLPIAAVALPHQDAGVNRLFDAQRRRWGVDVIPLDTHATARCLEQLRRGGAVGLLGDIAFGGHPAPARMFGQPVLLPRGPAVLAARAKAPILPVILLRERPFRFRLVIEPPLLPERPNQHGITALAEACAAAMERMIRRAPEQWLLMQPLQPASQAVRMADASAGVTHVGRVAAATAS